MYRFRSKMFFGDESTVISEGKSTVQDAGQKMDEFLKSTPNIIGIEKVKFQTLEDTRGSHQILLVYKEEIHGDK